VPNNPFGKARMRDIQMLDGNNMSRKQFLSRCVVGTIIIGFLLLTYPFLASWNPNPRSEIVKDINVAELPVGGKVFFNWRGKPAVLYKPTNEMVNYLVSLNEVANGPDYSTDDIPEFFVYTLVSTYLGCGLFDIEGNNNWSYKYVGYVDPCHRGFWDYAGRLLPKVHAGEGLNDLEVITSYVYISDSVIRFEFESF